MQLRLRFGKQWPPVISRRTDDGVLALVQAEGCDDGAHALQLRRLAHLPRQPQQRRIVQLQETGGQTLSPTSSSAKAWSAISRLDQDLLVFHASEGMTTAISWTTAGDLA